jgi:hypothetical protein
LARFRLETGHAEKIPAGFFRKLDRLENCPAGTLLIFLLVLLLVLVLEIRKNTRTRTRRRTRRIF